MVVNNLERVFFHKEKDIELSDANPNFTPEEILDLYSSQYPELTNATVKVGKIKDDKQVFEFVTTVGTKG